MARYKYNKEAVSGVIDQLNSAIDKLNDFNDEILSGFSTIQFARGGEYLSINSGSVLELKDISVEAIRKIIEDIRNKAQIIEEYNSASWLTKTFSSIGMAFSKIVEGFFSAGENIIDGFATVGGLVAGIFSEDAKNAVGEFVKKDHVGDYFTDAYSANGFLSGIEKYSAFSSESTAANVFKGVGVATGYAGVILLTGGAGATVTGESFATGAAGAMSSLGLNAAVTGIGGLGSGTEGALQEGMDFNHAALEGAKKGAVQAGTVVAFSKGTEVLGKGIQKVKSATAASSTASSTGTMPLGLPSGSKAIAEITTPVNSLATASSATSGLTDLVANVSKTGIPPALSVAPQYIDDGQRAIEQVPGDLLGNFTTPTVESTYVPGSMPIDDTPVQPDIVPMPTTSTPEPTVTTPTETIPTTNNPTTSTPTYTSPGPVYNSGGTSSGSHSTSAPVTSPSVPSEPTPVIDNPISEPVQPVETPVQPINISAQPVSTPSSPAISEPTIADDMPTIPTDETTIPDIPDDPIYKHQQTIRNSTTKSSNGIAKGIASTIVGLGAVGAAGAVGYGIYNKKKQEKEDEEEE